jgi:hypothetical protein
MFQRNPVESIKQIKVIGTNHACVFCEPFAEVGRFVFSLSKQYYVSVVSTHTRTARATCLKSL